MQKERDDICTASKVTVAAVMVRMAEVIMVIFLPAASKSAPVKTRPKPLQTASTPTMVVARAVVAPTESAKSRAKLITELPTAARQIK